MNVRFFRIRILIYFISQIICTIALMYFLNREIILWKVEIKDFNSFILWCNSFMYNMTIIIFYTILIFNPLVLFIVIFPAITRSVLISWMLRLKKLYNKIWYRIYNFKHKRKLEVKNDDM